MTNVTVLNIYRADMLILTSYFRLVYLSLFRNMHFAGGSSPLLMIQIKIKI